MRDVLAGTRGRVAVLGAVVAVAATMTGVAIVKAAAQQRAAGVPTRATRLDRALDLGAVLDVPHVVFRSTAPGPTYGQLAAVPLAAPSGPRSTSGLSCERVDATPAGGVCLTADRGALPTYRQELLGPRLSPASATPLTGVPSRARMSADGALVASTVFVSGHSYAQVGFSTQTRIDEVATGRSYPNLEKDFAVMIGGSVTRAADLNVWGVTFAPGPRTTSFYATVATGGRTWLVRGDLAARTMTALREDAECPSLSPDGASIVYKKRHGSPSRWQYYGYDVGSGREWPLAEARSVDDQAAWLDDTAILYGLPRIGTAQSDVWRVPLHGGRPSLFIPDAWSPAVVR